MLDYVRFILEDLPGTNEVFNLKDINPGDVNFFFNLSISKRFIIMTSNNIQDIGVLPRSFLENCAIFNLHTQERVDVSTIKQTHAMFHDAIEVRGSNVFRWRGGTWEIVYSGKIIQPVDSKGLRYIHHLMFNRNKSFYGLDLVNTTNSIQSEENKQLLLKRSVQVENGELDERLKEGIPPKQLKEALYVLNQKLESAETLDERESIQKQIDQIADRLESIKGENSADKARLSVYNAINRALEKIKEEHLLLYEYFRLSIKTGVSFKYETAEDIQWVLE